jgi:hypothetical protein
MEPLSILELYSAALKTPCDWLFRIHRPGLTHVPCAPLAQSIRGFPNRAFDKIVGYAILLHVTRATRQRRLEWSTWKV